MRTQHEHASFVDTELAERTSRIVPDLEAPDGWSAVQAEHAQYLKASAVYRVDQAEKESLPALMECSRGRGMRGTVA